MSWSRPAWCSWPRSRRPPCCNGDRPRRRRRAGACSPRRASRAWESVVLFVRGVRHPLGLIVAWLVLCAAAALVACLVIDARRHHPESRWRGVPRALRTGRRQYAGFAVHVGFLCLAIGVTGSSLGTRRRDFTLTEGDRVEWAGRSIRFVRIGARATSPRTSSSPPSWPSHPGADGSIRCDRPSTSTSCKAPGPRRRTSIPPGSTISTRSSTTATAGGPDSPSSRTR